MKKIIAKNISDKAISKDEYEDKIFQLIELARVNLEYCKQIKNFLGKKRKQETPIKFVRNKKVRYFILVSNNHFFEAVSEIHSLLNRHSKKKEVSLRNYYLNYCRKSSNPNLEQDIKCVRSKYENHELDDLRNNIIDHKSTENIGDSSIEMAICLMEDKWVNALDEIVNELKKITSQYFENHGRINLYDKNSLPEILEMVCK